MDALTPAVMGAPIRAAGHTLPHHWLSCCCASQQNGRPDFRSGVKSESRSYYP